MICHNEETNGLHRSHCAECGNDTFHNDIVYFSATKRSRIKRVVCAMCGETTDFVPTEPRDLASA